MKIQYNSPVTLTFTLICVIVLIIEQFMLNVGVFMQFFTVQPTMDLTNPIDYFRLFSHAIGHSNWEHLVGNFSLILLLGPILEEKYGSSRLLGMIFLTALVTGIINVLFFTSGLLGASGIVFMMILLSSVVNMEKGKIPLTFILILLLYLGKEVYNAFLVDTTSQAAHIIGGLFGAVFGFLIEDKETSKKKITTEK